MPTFVLLFDLIDGISSVFDRSRHHTQPYVILDFDYLRACV